MPAFSGKNLYMHVAPKLAPGPGAAASILPIWPLGSRVTNNVEKSTGNEGATQIALTGKLPYVGRFGQ